MNSKVYNNSIVISKIKSAVSQACFSVYIIQNRRSSYKSRLVASLKRHSSVLSESFCLEAGAIFLQTGIIRHIA